MLRKRLQLSAWSKLGEKAQETLTVGDVRMLGPLLVDDSETVSAPAAATPSIPLKSV